MQSCLIKKETHCLLMKRSVSARGWFIEYYYVELENLYANKVALGLFMYLYYHLCVYEYVRLHVPILDYS